MGSILQANLFCEDSTVENLKLYRHFRLVVMEGNTVFLHSIIIGQTPIHFHFDFLHLLPYLTINSLTKLILSIYIQEIIILSLALVK
uniref:Uncharacterized protein n=1 Tax=Nelumbo nucifera TaxID=4432 RepID=A0A822XEZ8_NELNU|nr:TPA_asm: hypothetical protein HUJ06_020230 [Nelumbo nucifera]